MNKATLDRIFEPFFTTKKAGCATGLGLSTVHSLVAQSDGYINASSQPGQGTTFEIMLPCVGTFRGFDEGFMPEHSAGEGPATVLLVEDEDSVRRIMHKYLERAGYQLLEARNAEEAEEVARVYREPIHVMVTGIAMPGLTGPELAERLTPLRPEMKVLFVSGYRHDTLEHCAHWKAELNLLSKPFPPTELVRRVQILLREGAPLPQ